MNKRPTDTSNNKPVQHSTDGWWSLRDFLVDLFGSLVPGILFIFVGFVAIAWPARFVLQKVQAVTDSNRLMEQVYQFGSTFRFELAIFLVVASYVAGHFLYRQDPKAPDRASYRRVSKTFSDGDKRGWVVQALPDRPDDEVDVQFPYRFLKEYLVERELHHLARLVPWSGTDEESYRKRTKSFINFLKIRLFFHFPDRGGQLTRNEAHVRLMSSIWYAARTLTWMALASMTIAVVAAYLFSVPGVGWEWGRLTGAVLSSSVVLVLVLWARRVIERFLHYQRVREVLFVLETAFVAARERPEILDDLF
jgi:hypothetical protein